MDNAQRKIRNRNLEKRQLAIPSTALLDCTCILWFSSMPMRVLISKVFGSAVNRPVAGMIIYIPLLVYMIVERKIPWKYFHWVFLACAAFFAGTLMLHPDYMPWYTREDYGVMYAVLSPDHGAVWAFLMMEICQNKKRMWKNIKWIAFFTALYSLYRMYVASVVGYWGSYDMYGNIRETNYSLDFGYDMIFVLLVSFVCYCYSKKAVFLVIDLLTAFLALRYGSRGAFLCVIVFLALFF